MVSLSSLISIGSLVSLLSLLTQSTSGKTCLEKDDGGEWNIESFVGDSGSNNAVWRSTLAKVHISHLLHPLVHPGSAVILTDCVTEFISEDVLLFSSLSLAILNSSMLGEIQPGLFPERKPLIVLNLPENISRIATKQIYDSYQVPSTRIKKWQPTILIIRKELADITQQFAIMERTFTDIRMYYDCAVFMIFLEPGFLTMSQTPTQENSSLLNLAIWEAYGVKEGSKKFNLLSKVLVPSHNGEEVSLDNFARRRRNFHLEKLSASVKQDPYFTDWVTLDKMEDGSLTIIGGYVSYLYRDMQMMMNFSEEIMLGDSLSVFPNGTVLGTTAKQLSSGEADLSLNQISFSMQRAKAFTFLHPTYHSLVHAFFKQPAQSSIRDIVISAFEKDLWIALIGVWAMFVLAMKVRLVLLSRGSSLELKFPFLRCEVAAGDRKFSKESVLWSVAAFSQKSWYLGPQSTSLRMKVMIGSLSTLIAYNAYSASIVSHLAVGRVPVKTFDDLINFKFIFTVHEQSEPYKTLLEGMIESYSLAQDVTTTSTEREISHLYTGSEPSVKSTGMAFLSPADMFFKTADGFNYSHNFMCDHISNLHAGSYYLKSGMLVSKESDYKEILNYMLAYLRARGLIDRNIASYNVRNFLRCLPMDQRSSPVEPAEFSDVFSSTLVLFVGLPLALLVLLVEMTYARGSSGNGKKGQAVPVPLNSGKKKDVGATTYKQAYFNDLITSYTA